MAAWPPPRLQQHPPRPASYPTVDGLAVGGPPTHPACRLPPPRPPMTRRRLCAGAVRRDQEVHQPQRHPLRLRLNARQQPARQAGRWPAPGRQRTRRAGRGSGSPGPPPLHSVWLPPSRDGSTRVRLDRGGAARWRAPAAAPALPRFLPPSLSALRNQGACCCPAVVARARGALLRCTRAGVH